MTHSLHRCGSVDSLKDDFVLIAAVSSANRDAVASTMSEVAEIMFDAGLSNIGSRYLDANLPGGLDREEFIKGITIAHKVECAFSSKEKLRDALAKLKEADLGISITVSGLIDEVIPMAREMGLKPHTADLSLGIVGDLDMLAEEGILKVTTMCGHSVVSTDLVQKGIQDVASGDKTPREASMMVARPCLCGLFNLERGALLLRQLAEPE